MQIDPKILSENAQYVADLLKQLSNKNRLMILCCLAEAELSVGEINERIELSQSALSQHLAKLRDSGLVATRRSGQTIYYRVADTKVEALLQSLHQIFCPV